MYIVAVFICPHRTSLLRWKNTPLFLLCKKKYGCLLFFNKWQTDLPHAFFVYLPSLLCVAVPFSYSQKHTQNSVCATKGSPLHCDYTVVGLDLPVLQLFGVVDNILRQLCNCEHIVFLLKPRTKVEKIGQKNEFTFKSRKSSYCGLW